MVLESFQPLLRHFPRLSCRLRVGCLVSAVETVFNVVAAPDRSAVIVEQQIPDPWEDPESRSLKRLLIWYRPAVWFPKLGVLLSRSSPGSGMTRLPNKPINMGCPFSDRSIADQETRNGKHIRVPPGDLVLVP